MSESMTSPRKLRHSERKALAVERRKGGDTYEQIAARLGISKAQAFYLVQEAMRESAEKASLDAAELRQLEMQRLDLMRSAIWAQVLTGDVQAVQTALKISKRMSELTGIDAPVKNDLSVSAGKRIVVKIGDDAAD